MTPSRPYLIRALYEWIEDNALTPHILVDAAFAGTEVPLQYVENDRIVLNISARAVGNLSMSNDRVEFQARFGGTPTQVSVPVPAVLAIYARENGKGMVFGPEDGDEPPPTPEKEDAEKAAKRPALRVVK